ncbi:hypothetical protein D9M69_395600 [compost metagenome]
MTDRTKRIATGADDKVVFQRIRSHHKWTRACLLWINGAENRRARASAIAVEIVGVHGPAPETGDTLTRQIILDHPMILRGLYAMGECQQTKADTTPVCGRYDSGQGGLHIASVCAAFQRWPLNDGNAERVLHDCASRRLHKRSIEMACLSRRPFGCFVARLYFSTRHSSISRAISSSTLSTEKSL